MVLFLAVLAGGAAVVWAVERGGSAVAADAAEPPRPAAQPPRVVVFMTFDEFPVDVLRLPDGHIDPARFPNLAAFARTATWFPNTQAVHDSTEDVGFGRRRLRIRFVEPWKLGFPRDTLERPNVGLVSCAVVGEPRLGVEHTCLAHVFLRSPDDGLVLRSRFWIGAALRPYGPRPLGQLATPLLRRKLVRRVAIPRVAPRSLLLHCGEEFANLAAILPDLYARFGCPS